MQNFTTFFKVSLFLLTVVFIASAGPDIHSAYVRGYVGSKTVMIKKDRSGGSGFFVKAPSGKTYILTNRHVCDLSKDGTLEIILPSNSRQVTKNIIESYEHHDLCLVEGEGSYTGLDLASFLFTGQTIAIMGHPKLHPLTLSKGEYIGDKVIQVLLGYNIPEEECQGTVRQASFMSQFFGNFTMCIGEFYAGQITAYSRGGSSGSPIINFFGNVVGVLFAGNTGDQFESYIVLLDDVKNFLRDY